jgi:hypothetical protein
MGFYEEQTMTSMFAIRWVMVALTAVLAAVLISRGNVVIGGILAALAIMRIVLLVGMQKRRAQFRQRREQFGARRRQRTGSGL